MRVIVSGGGLVGLTVAHAVIAAGHEVVILERHDSVRSTGASLTLWPPTSAVFDRYGLMNEIAAHSATGDLDTLHEPGGRVLARRPFEPAIASYPYPMFTIYRPLLNRILAEPLGDAVRLGRAVTRYSESDDGVTAFCSDGSLEEGDLLIGADGIGSAVRGQMHPEARIIDARYASWRAVLPEAPVELAEQQWVDGRRSTRGGFLRAGDGRVFWGISQGDPVPRGAVALKAEALDQLEHMDDGGWGWPMRALIEATPEELITRDDVGMIAELPSWTTRRVTLAGDAAHAMPPHVASGAAYGIEDAYVLERCLAAERGPAALGDYDEQRRERMRWVFAEAAAVLVAPNYGQAWARFVVDSLRRGPQPADILLAS